MAGYNTVTLFCDESGKFKDHKVISFGGVAAYNEDFGAFANEWQRLLFKNGLKELSAKNALNHRRYLSAKNRRIGITKRIEDLKPFIACIRNHLQVIMSVTVDVRAFRSLPQHTFRSYGDDPVILAFARSVLEVIRFTHDHDKVSFVCDDDEETAITFFRLYRRIKRIMPEARDKLAAITFADDKVLFALQAADLISGIIRLEAGRRMRRVPYDYAALFKALSVQPKPHEKIWQCEIAFCNKRVLQKLAASLAKKRKEVSSNVKAK